MKHSLKSKFVQVLLIVVSWFVFFFFFEFRGVAGTQYVQKSIFLKLVTKKISKVTIFECSGSLSASPCIHFVRFVP